MYFHPLIYAEVILQNSPPCYLNYVIITTSSCLKCSPVEVSV